MSRKITIVLNEDDLRFISDSISENVADPAERTGKENATARKINNAFLKVAAMRKEETET